MDERALGRGFYAAFGRGGDYLGRMAACLRAVRSLGIIWAVAFFLWYRDNPLDNPKLNEAERDLLRILIGPSAHSAVHSRAPWGKMVSSGRVWLLCWQYFFLSYGWYFNITWLPTYLREARGMDVAQAAMFGVLPLFMGGLGNPVSVVLGERLLRWTKSVDRTRRIVASFGYTRSLRLAAGDHLHAGRPSSRDRDLLG